MKDLSAFLKSQPNKLIPLNLEGAYTYPPVPDGFDAETASPDELARYGFHVSRPRDDQPEALAAWREIFARKWKASDCIVPKLSVQKGKTHQLRGAQTLNGAANAAATSNNWAGAVVTNRGGAPVPNTACGIDGYVTPWNSQPHVNYVGADNNIYELYWNGNLWVYNNLSALTGAPAAALGTPVVGYITPWNNQQHVIYTAADNTINEIYWNGQQWQHNNLSQLAGAPVGSLPRAGLTGYVTSYNQQQHVNYVGTDYHVHELVYGGGHWVHNDLTQLAGSPPTALTTRLAGYETPWNNQQHVIFIDTNIHIHELYYAFGRWNHNDLTQNTPGAAAVTPAWPENALTGYATTYNNQEHVVYLGINNHVHELYNNGHWNHNDLTGATGATLAGTSNGIDGYVTPWNNEEHINFVGTDSHVHELYYDGQRWQHNDLTVASGAQQLAVAHSVLAGYVTPWENQQHVIFLGADGHVHELKFDSSWHRNDLTLAATIPWKSAIGTWNIPTISQPRESPGPNGWDSSSWAGIDGWGSNDVLQAGVEQGLYQSPFGGPPSPYYVAWYEWYAPAQGIFGTGSPGYIHQTNIDNFPVAPGQTVYCAAQYINNQSAGNLIFINKTTGQYFSITLAPPPGATFSGNSIEWIMEAPDGGWPLTSLPAFNPIVFFPAYGFDEQNDVGSPANGFAVDINVGGKALTSVAIQSEQVTVKFTG